MRAFPFWLTWAVLAAACGGGRDARDDAPASEPAQQPEQRSLLVFAAASLRESFEAIAADFERAHPGVKVQLNLAGTQELRAQIEHGAPADVLASADQRHMDALVRQNRVQAPQLFARNEPVIVVPRGSKTVASIADLPRAKRIVLAAPEVPLGAYTQQILDRAGQQLGSEYTEAVRAHVVSRELNARQVLAKVRLGEADAAIVYRSDALAAKGEVERVPIAANLNVSAEYPIAVVAGAPQPELARAFVGMVRSAQGQAILERAGFTPATGSGTAAK